MASCDPVVGSELEGGVGVVVAVVGDCLASLRPRLWPISGKVRPVWWILSIYLTTSPSVSWNSGSFRELKWWRAGRLREGIPGFTVSMAVRSHSAKRPPSTSFFGPWNELSFFGKPLPFRLTRH
jgi:hypothetical protein